MSANELRLRGFMFTLILFGLGLVCTEFLQSTGLDVFLSRSFYVPGGMHGGWPFGQDPLLRFMYDYGTIRIWLLFGTALILYGAAWRHLLAERFKKPCLVIILTILIGPGLLVNGVLKPVWGRPRPADLVHSGGNSQYRTVWQPGGPGAGKSFPSGHCSMAFSFASGASLFSAQPVVAMALVLTGIGYGILMGVTRMSQGGHFPTDVLWSGVLVLMIALILHYLVLRVSEQNDIRLQSKKTTQQ